MDSSSRGWLLLWSREMSNASLNSTSWKISCLTATKTIANAATTFQWSSESTSCLPATTKVASSLSLKTSLLLTWRWFPGSATTLFAWLKLPWKKLSFRTRRIKVLTVPTTTTLNRLKRLWRRTWGPKTACVWCQLSTTTSCHKSL